MESLAGCGRTWTIAFILCLTGAGCAPPEMDSLVSFTSAGRLNAYIFEVTNVTDSPVTGIHLLLQAERSTMPPKAPRHWEGYHEADGLHFVTPPSDAVGSRAKRPILPGRAAGPFEFTLVDEQVIDRILLEHPDSSTRSAPAGSLLMGGTPLETGVDGTVSMRPAGKAYSFTLLVSAPENRPIGRVQFEVVGEGSVEGAVTEAEWRVSPSSRKITCWAPGDRAPIQPGRSRSFTLCADRPKLEIEWSLVGLDQETIGEGTTTLAFTSP